MHSWKESNAFEMNYRSVIQKEETTYMKSSKTVLKCPCLNARFKKIKWLRII